MHIRFRPAARLLTRTLHPAPRVDLSAIQEFLAILLQDKDRTGVLLTVNHYSAPDFQSWWFVIPISAVFPVEIHWLVAAAWRNSGWFTGFSQWLFPRGARILGFTAMPPMPPDPAETEARANAVREAIHYAKTTSHPVIGIAPEGGDQPGGVLGTLPPGVGRFMHMLSHSCTTIIPVGAWKEQGCIYLNFGGPYQLDIPRGLTPDGRDELVGNIVMHHIAELLPHRLRGKYG